MAGAPSDGRRTEVQKLPELIEWFLSSKEVELKFVPNERRIGRLAPEWDFVYWLDGRRITERALAMGMATEFSRMNYGFSLGKVIAALTAIAWQHYVSNQEYPAWMKAEAKYEPLRPVGRPRKHPKKISMEELNSVNTQDTKKVSE